jgi:SnoaL-like domain
MTTRTSNRRHFLAAGSAGALAGLAMTPATSSAATPAAAPVTCGAMSRERYLQYLNWFNANDPRFLDFYHEDVVLELAAKELHGRKAIADFYTEVKAHIHETVQVTHYVADATGIAAELPSEFKVYKDWVGGYFGRALKAGEVFRIISLGMYQIDNGKFRHIKAARYKLVNDWRMEP